MEAAALKASCWNRIERASEWNGVRRVHGEDSIKKAGGSRESMMGERRGSADRRWAREAETSQEETGGRGGGEISVTASLRSTECESLRIFWDRNGIIDAE